MRLGGSESAVNADYLGCRGVARGMHLMDGRADRVAGSRRAPDGPLRKALTDVADRAVMPEPRARQRPAGDRHALKGPRGRGYSLEWRPA